MLVYCAKCTCTVGYAHGVCISYELCGVTAKKGFCCSCIEHIMYATFVHSMSLCRHLLCNYHTNLE